MRPTLAEIVNNKKLEVENRRQTTPLSSFADQVTAGSGAFVTRVTQSGINLIAEIKPKSPSAGVLREGAHLDVGIIATLYNKYAKGISVLTDKKFFGGSISLLERVAAQVSVPVLCKDFVIDAYQIYEARKAGAQAVLLIVKILSDQQLASLQQVSRDLGMTAVIEVQQQEELNRALESQPDILLINNRDLSTFETDLTTTEHLSSSIPSHIPFISASGIENAADINRLLPYTNVFLIGSSIMRADNVEEKLQELCEVSTRCPG